MALADSTQNDPQPYDSLVKHLFHSEAEKVVPLLLQGAELVSHKNVEINRSTLKVDLALKIRYCRELAIFHFEAQTDEDREMEKRMSLYNAGLHSAYGLPVISILLYLFKCARIESPYHVTCAGRKCSSCYYDVICLWEVDPQPYIDEHTVPLYVLLPGMKNPSVTLLKRAIKEIVEYYDEKRAIDRLIQFGVMLKRTTTVSASSKQKLQEELNMYTPYQEFIKQNPDVERIAKQKEMEGEMRGKIEGKVEGKVEGKIDSILTILNFRFPNDMLIDFAKQALGSIHDIEVLGQLEREALRSPDEQYIHKQLSKYLSQNRTESIPEGDVERDTEGNR